MKPNLLFIILLSLSHTFSFSQVITNDSLAVVELYEYNHGDLWENADNWLQSNVTDWYGVTVDNQRIVGLDLPHNNIIGDLASSINKLDNLQTVNLANNNLTSLPEIQQLHQLQYLNVSGNHLSFCDIIKNISLVPHDCNFIYGSQDYIPAESYFCRKTGFPVDLHNLVDYQVCRGDQFQWIKNGEDIPKATAFNYSYMPGNQQVDFNTFSLQITNSLAPGLTLFSKKIQVQDYRPVEKVLQDVNFCNNELTIQADTNLQGGTGRWSVYHGWGNLSSYTQPKIHITNLQEGTNIFSWNVYYGFCLGGTDNITIQSASPPDKAFAGDDKHICEKLTQLSGNFPTIGWGEWNVISGDVSFSNIHDNNTDITIHSSGEHILTWTIKNPPCHSSAPDTIIINRDAYPSDADAGHDRSFCSDSTTLQATEIETGSGKWSVIEGAAEFSDESDPYTYVKNLKTGINVLEWRVSNGICADNSDEILLISFPPPINIYAGKDRSICEKSIFLNAASPNNGYGTWKKLSGKAYIQSPQKPNTVVKNLSYGENKFLWEVKNDYCQPVYDTLTINYLGDFSFIDAGDKLEICEDYAVLDAYDPLIGKGTWQVVSGAGHFEEPHNPKTYVSNLNRGDNIFRWKVEHAECGVKSDDVIIHSYDFTENAYAGEDLVICDTKVEMRARQPRVGQGTWSIAYHYADIDEIHNPASVISDIPPGETGLEWKISFKNCPTKSDTVIITREENNISVNAGPDIEICNKSTFLDAKNPPSGKAIWIVVSGAGKVEEPHNNKSKIVDLSQGENVIRWQLENTTCGKIYDDVIITSYRNLEEAYAGENMHLCKRFTELSATAPQTGTGKWRIIRGKGEIVNPGSAHTPINNLISDTTILVWEIFYHICDVKRDTLEIYVHDNPDIAYAGNDTSICSNEITLEAAPLQKAKGKWSISKGSGTIKNPDNHKTKIKGLAAGDNILVWVAKTDYCGYTTDTIKINTYSFDENPFAGYDQTICASSTTLSAHAPKSGSGFWSSPDSLITIESPAQPVTKISGLSVGKNKLFWTLNYRTCEPRTDKVVIHKLADFGFVSPGKDQDVCTDSTSLNAVSPAGTSPSWEILEGNSVISDILDPKAQVYNLSLGINKYKFKVEHPICGTKNKVLTITRKEVVEGADAGEDIMTCEKSIRLNAKSPDTGHWVVVEGKGKITDITDKNTKVTELTPGENVFRWVVDNNFCTPKRASEITVMSVGYPKADAGYDLTLEYSASQKIQLQNKSRGYGQENFTWLWTPTKYVDDSTAFKPMFLSGFSDSIKMTLHVTNELGCSASDDVIIRFIIEDLKKAIPTLFTPNGDGTNDLFVIIGIDRYKDNSLSLFNKTGKLVYQKKPYENTFDGRANTGISFNGAELPADTYYYVLDLGQDYNNKIIKGFVRLER